jgi:hypothetical protein
MKMILEDHLGDKPDLEDTIMLKLFKIWFDSTVRQLPALRHAIGEFFAGCGCMSARTQKLVGRVSLPTTLVQLMASPAPKIFVPAYREAAILRVRHGKGETDYTSAEICEKFYEWTHPQKLEAYL